jgi:biotin transport system permease protein
MADLSFLGYRAGRSPVHAMDARLKLGLTALATVAAGTSAPAGLAVLAVLAAAFFALAGFAPAPRALRALLPLAAIVVAGRTLAEPGTAGLLGGLLYCARLLLMALLGSLLASTTTVAAFRAALAWLLRPLRAGVGPRAAAMASLAMASLPLLGRELELLRLARAARLAEKNRSIRERALSLLRPLVRRSLLRADALAAAMEARCWSEAAAGPPLPAPRPWEWGAFAGSALATAAAFLLR